MVGTGLVQIIQNSWWNLYLRQAGRVGHKLSLIWLSTYLGRSRSRYRHKKNAVFLGAIRRMSQQSCALVAGPSQRSNKTGPKPHSATTPIVGHQQPHSVCYDMILSAPREARDRMPLEGYTWVKTCTWVETYANSQQPSAVCSCRLEHKWVPS